MSPAELREARAERGGVACLELVEWRERYGVIAGITLRDNDWGLASPEPASAVVGRWLDFRRQLLPEFTSVVVARQCHGTRVVVHERAGVGWQVLDEADGHLSDQPGLLITITVADCVPIYLADPAGRWVGLLHAGWRGVAGGMVESGITTFADAASCSRDVVVIHCGVSICDACYEVGPEVVAAVSGETTREPGGLDLRSAIARRAARAGVKQVTVSPWCTAHDATSFHSHRRSRGSDGRMVAYIGRPLA